MDSLKRFLVELLPRFGYKDGKAIRSNVYSALYWAVTGQGEYFNELFTGETEDHEILRDYKWDPKDVLRRKPFYVNVGNKEYSHPKEQICGYNFKEGDAIYRCEECGYDDTCVLCAHCFSKDDHLQHNVSLYYAGSGNEGMCDCGDDTAFNQRLDCACQRALSVAPKFESLIQDVLRVAFDYILDVTNFSISPLPFIHRNLEGRGHLSFDTRQLSDFSGLPFHKYGAVDQNTYDTWYLVLWNDENHNYDEAQTAIRAATGFSNSSAENIAKLINASGRAVLKEATKPGDLFKSQKLAEMDGLVCTITSRRDYVREMIVDATFHWVCEILSFSANSAFREECKKQLSIVLLESDFQFARSLPPNIFSSQIPNLMDECSRCGLVVDGSLKDTSPVLIVKNDYSLDCSVDHLLKPDPSYERYNSRLQYLLLFEVRFPLRTRKLARKVFLTLIGGDKSSKAIFSDQYIEVYSQLLLISAFSDREENLSCMDHIRIQLLSCPRTNQTIIESGNLRRILGPLCWLIEHFATMKNSLNGFATVKEIVYDLRSKREKSSIEKAIVSATNDLTHVLAKNTSSNVLNCVSQDNTHYLLLSLMKYFQGSSSIIRKTGDHITQELLRDVLIFLQRASPIYFITKSVTQGSWTSDTTLLRILEDILRSVSHHNQRFSTTGNGRVSSDPVSLINPINAFLSRLLQATSPTELKELVVRYNEAFISMAGVSLRSIVVNSQVKIGLWIRNGSAISRQAAYYSEFSLKELSYFRDMQYIPSAGVCSLGELAYSRDLHLLQTALIFCNPREMFHMIINLWEFDDWYNGNASSKSSVYEDRFGYACEQLIKILYHLFTDRSAFSSESQKDSNDNLTMKVAYSLCDKPKSFSELIAEFDGDDVNMNEFETKVQQCALLQSPSGITDSGVYRLKNDFYELLDPLSSCVELSRFESVAESLIKNLSNSRKVKETDVVLQPRIVRSKAEFINTNLMMFYTTKDFAKLLYKLMRESIDSNQEIYIQQLLHLLHAILQDTESSEEHENQIDAFVDIPICDLLLTIAESSMSGPVTVKADFLLTKLIDMDSRVTKSLLDCFGESHIQQYKKRKFGDVSHRSESRKTTAEKRKARIMKKLAKQQRSFQAHNELEDSSTNLVNPNIRHCVICGEPESSSELFGILLCLTNNSIFWKVPTFDKTFSRLAFSDFDVVPPVEKHSIYSRGYPYKKMREKGLTLQISATVATSCGHGIHYACYARQPLRMHLFPCLLCHNVHHGFLPSFMVSAKTDCEAGDWRQKFEAEMDEQNCNRLAKDLLHDSYRIDDSKQLKKMMPGLRESFDRMFPKSHGKFEIHLHELSRLIANTIRANEIATRIEGNDAYRNFLDMTSSQFRLTVISLLQYHAVLSSHALTNVGDDQAFEESSIFTEVIMKYLSGNGHLSTFIQDGYIELLTLLTFELMDNVKHQFLSFFEELASTDYSSTTTQAVLKFFKHYLGDIIQESEIRSHGDAIISFLITSLTRVASTYLRQCAIFWDLITGTQLTSGFESSSEIGELKRSLLGADDTLLVNVLCSFFELPNVSRFFEDVTSADPQWSIAANYTSTKYYEEKSKLRTLIDFPGKVSLVSLPNDYNICVTDPVFKNKKAQTDSICLSCGKYLTSRQVSSHHQECSWMSIYFAPNKNTLKMSINLDISHFNAEFPAPYLTIHGEVKRRGVHGKAALSSKRFAHINKLWLNCGIYGFVTRLFFDGQPLPLFRPDFTTFDEVFDGEEDDFIDEIMIPSD